MLFFPNLMAQAVPMSPKSLEEPGNGVSEAPSNNPNAKTNLMQRLNSLNLTDNQNAAIIEMHKNWKGEKERQLKENLRAARQELNLAMTGNSQIDDIRKKFESLQKNYLELQNLTFEKSLKIREILSPDQRRKFQDLRLDASE